MSAEVAPPMSLTSALRSVAGEKYFRSELGYLLRVITPLQANNGVDSDRPILLQVFTEDGKKVLERVKRYESVAAFSLQFSDEFRKSSIFPLDHKPKTIALPNRHPEAMLAASAFQLA